MRIQSYIMIHCIASDTINIEELSINLKKLLQQQFSFLDIMLESNAPYWKEPGFKSIVYSIANDYDIKVFDLIKIFFLSWQYSQGYVYNIEIKERVDNEEAIWSQLCYPKEFFLNSIVDWVHIYTVKKFDLSVNS